MTIKIVLVVLLIQSFAAAQCHTRGPQEMWSPRRQSAPGPRSLEWGAATYRELTVGKSTVADMLRIMGKPNWSGPPGDQTNDEPNPEVWNEYQRGGELPGKLTVITDKASQRIVGIELYPDSLSKDEAVRHFGTDYVVTEYDFDKCLGDEDSAPLYESPGGPLLYLEYRARGIAVAVDEQQRVRHISYVSKPIGTPSSRCKTQ